MNATVIRRNTESDLSGGSGPPPCANPPFPDPLPVHDGHLHVWRAVTASSLSTTGGASETRALVGVAFQTHCPTCGQEPGLCPHNPGYFILLLSLGSAADLISALARAYLFGCWHAGVLAASSVKALAGKLFHQELDRLACRCRTLEDRLDEFRRQIWVAGDDEGLHNVVTAVGVRPLQSECDGPLSSCSARFEAQARDGTTRNFSLRMTWGNAKWLARRILDGARDRRDKAEEN